MIEKAVQIMTEPYKTRPLEELRCISTKKWTKDELSAFGKFRGGDLDNFVKEWETICNKLNPNRNKSYIF